MGSAADKVELDDRRWIPGLGRQPDAAVRLFCLPYAGGGASTFNRWAAHLPGWIETCPVALPGREQRMRERPFTDMAGLIETLSAVVERHAEKPFALFGHSMGAIVAFELARELQRRGVPGLHLFASAHRAPEQPRSEPPLHGLADGELVEALGRKYDAIPPEIAREPAFLRLLLPLWRADFELIERYAYAAGERLECPLTVFAGGDDPFTRDDDLELWRKHTTASFRLHALPGDHFFPDSARVELLRALSEDLASSLHAARAKSAGERRDLRST